MKSKDSTAFKVPKHLRKPTQTWFKSVTDDFDLEPHHIKLLTLAAEAWDRAVAAREVIDAQGLTYLDRFDQPKARPEVAIERDSRIGFARLIRELALDGVESLETPRVPRTADYGNRR
ncbi:hypothetical protein [Brucella intermedia]|uniref:hypothetical protein n=1 Tax=Brucella intermedia TaxID=94625 RepID=UPI00165CF4ED|nr:hypothetical protein [Brucella intermedia]QNQ40050.1 hypothetical protein IAR37_11980 [Brucella intermedia]